MNPNETSCVFEIAVQISRAKFVYLRDVIRNSETVSGVGAAAFSRSM